MHRWLHLPLGAVLLGSFLSLTSFGQELPPPAAPPIENVAEVVRTYEAQEKAIEAEIAPQLAAAKAKFEADLNAVADKLTQNKKTGEADTIKREIERFQKYGITAVPNRNAPLEVRNAWTALIRANQAADDTIRLRRNSNRSKYMQALVAAERAAKARGDIPGVAAARRAEQSLAIRQALADPTRVGITEVAGRDRSPWQDVPKEGMPLIGFRGNTGGWFQFTVLGSLQPVFLSPEGQKLGVKRGSAGDGPMIVAKDGYAVGGILIHSGEVVDGIQIVFMKIKPDGLSLDPQDRYVSDWLGSPAKGKPREISAKGRMVVGVTGTTTDVVEALGLVFLK